MSSLTLLLLAIVAGLAVGGIAGWLLSLRRSTADPSRGILEAELRGRITHLESELQGLRSEVTAARSAAAAAGARREAAEGELATTRGEVHRLQEIEAELRATVASHSENLAGARASLGALQERTREQQARHEEDLRTLRDSHSKALADLREAFKALSADALRQVQPEFLRLANETLSKVAESAKGDLSQRQESIAGLVKPLEEQLQTYQQRLQQSETTQSSLLGEVRKQLETLAQQSQSLSTETLQLRKVLSSNQARGRWGEETLRRVVETAGMSAHCDFTEQAQMDESKPDLLIHMPGDRVIIVDAKVPDLAFLDALDNADPTRRAEALQEHAAKLKGTVKSLADRDYPSKFPNALDYVVLFVPAESLFSAALEGDRELMIWAQNRRILIATPCSLVAILRSVSLSWHQYSQTQNARDIALAAQELYTRVCKFTEHFERVRDGLDKATTAYNQAVGSYERQVRPSAERLKELGGGVEGRSPAEISPLEPSLRLPPPPKSQPP
ncbi:MAG TPA: DNA recombination protein RmuC, partial [Verrucomicrobiales bacterium]|nr:DNA recombination protein RmuC [Verrucomicrobiales bacterium]